MCKASSCWAFGAAAGSQNDALRGGSLEIGMAEQPGALLKGMDGVDVTALCRQPQRLGRDADNRCGVG